MIIIITGSSGHIINYGPYKALLSSISLHFILPIFSVLIYYLINSFPQVLILMCLKFIFLLYFLLTLLFCICVFFNSVQFGCCVISNSVTPWTAACLDSLSITNSPSLLKPMSIESVMQSNHLILCQPLLLLSSIFPSTMAFSNESVLHIRWPKYWSFSFSISPSKRIFRTDFLQDWLVGSPCSTRDSRVFSNFPVQKHQLLSAQLYGPTLTFIHDYWKNHIFDQTDLCRQSRVSVF